MNYISFKYQGKASYKYNICILSKTLKIIINIHLKLNKIKQSKLK